MIANWPAPGDGGEEYALAFDRGRVRRLLVVPAPFDEANKLRRFTVETMRALDAAGIDSFLPDLPGCNESLAPLAAQTLAGWREVMQAAARHFGATHWLAIRGGCLCAPDGEQTASFAPSSGAAILRAMLRAHVLSEREAGRETSREEALALGLCEGLTLGGHTLSATMITELEAAQCEDGAHQIAQTTLGGAGLWLRAEPADDPAQSQALAAAVQAWLA